MQTREPPSLRTHHSLLWISHWQRQLLIMIPIFSPVCLSLNLDACNKHSLRSNCSVIKCAVKLINESCAREDQMSVVRAIWLCCEMVFFTFSLAWSYISGINVVEKYLREGMLYLGSRWFIRAVNPVSSTMEKGWKSRAYEQCDYMCFWVAFVIWFRLLKASINSRLRAVTGDGDRQLLSSSAADLVFSSSSSSVYWEKCLLFKWFVKLVVVYDLAEHPPLATLSPHSSHTAMLLSVTETEKNPHTPLLLAAILK